MEKFTLQAFQEKHDAYFRSPSSTARPIGPEITLSFEFSRPLNEGGPSLR
jgi:hypothetical protein